MLYNTSPDGIEMNVAHQFQQIRIFLAQKGFISILKQMTVTAMASIELLSISGQ